MKRLLVRDRVMTCHGASTSGSLRVLTVSSLQRFNMEALIPAPADCEMWSMITSLNSQSIVPVEIHRQLCQVYGQTRLDDLHIPWRSSAGRCLIIIHPIARVTRLGDISPFGLLKKEFCDIYLMKCDYRHLGDICHETRYFGYIMV